MRYLLIGGGAVLSLHDEPPELSGGAVLVDLDAMTQMDGACFDDEWLPIPKHYRYRYIVLRVYGAPVLCEELPKAYSLYEFRVIDRTTLQTRVLPFNDCNDWRPVDDIDGPHLSVRLPGGWLVIDIAKAEYHSYATHRWLTIERRTPTDARVGHLGVCVD